MTTEVELPADSFEREVKNADVPVVIEFWIRSCSFCQKFKPIYEQLPMVFQEKIKFFKMNMFLTLENLHLAESLGVEDTPTLILFCKGDVIGTIVGYRSRDDVIKEIKAILENEECYDKR
jgi:thioredoxin 1